MSETTDPRWSQLEHHSWKCTSCEQLHFGVIDLACGKPDFWEGSKEKQPNASIAGATNILTEDFCIVDGERYFVRCVLEIPLIGAPGEHFAYGVWSSLSKKNFDIYTAHFNEEAGEDLGPWFGWFSNRLSAYPDTLSLKCRVHPQNDRQRPCIQLEPSDHPLSLEAQNGITYERLIQIYRAHGHDFVGPPA